MPGVLGMPRLSEATSHAQRIAIILAVLRRGERARQQMLGAPKRIRVRDAGKRYFTPGGRLTGEGARLDREIRQLAQRAGGPEFGLRDVLSGFTFDDPLFKTDLYVGVADRSTISVWGEVLQRNGTSVGKFERSIWLDEREVLHARFFLDRAVQGQGIGTKLNSASDAFYRKIGIRAVRLEANGSSSEKVNGRMIWPRQGFDFADPAVARRFATRFLDALEEGYGRGSPEVNAFSRLMQGGRVVHSWEIAAFRDHLGGRPGLEFLRTAETFDARRTLDPDSMSDKVWRNFQEREIQRVLGIRPRRTTSPVPTQPEKPDLDDGEPRARVRRVARIVPATLSVGGGSGRYYQVWLGNRQVGVYRRKDHAQEAVHRLTTRRRRRRRLQAIQLVMRFAREAAT